jgi:hypothetical protein
MPDAKNQNIIDIGSAIMYLTFCTKFNRRKKLPMNPHAREAAFDAISLNQFQ